MLKLTALLLLVPTLPGCRDDRTPNVITPGGYRVLFHDQGSMALHDVGALFDGAVGDARAQLWPYGIDAHEVDVIARGYFFVAHDEFKFATSASPTGMASGQIHFGSTIMLAFYSRRYDASGPTWTWFDWGGTTAMQSGGLPSAYPALGHELGHHFFGAAFEHGWLPPIVNGSARVGAPPNWDDSCPVR